MRIKQIAANNFRTLQDFELDFGNTYCAISGKNNAGKSAIIKVIQNFFESRDSVRYFLSGSDSINCPRDVTQWSDAKEFWISIDVEIDRQNDTELFLFVEKYSGLTLGDTVVVSMKNIFSSEKIPAINVEINGRKIEDKDAQEVLKKFRGSSNLVVHNSVSPNRSYYYAAEGYREILQAHFSQTDRKKIADAEKNLHTKIRQAAKQHKSELEKLLGKLSDKYDVDFTAVESGRSSDFPLEITLTDKSVEVPLSYWGAGTQNRTRILMSILDAIRNRSEAVDTDRSTPVFLVEEPESFLHPSAQAEFGRVLNELAEELKIQIIATTHSPYMLNQARPEANVLLERKIFRSALRETRITSTNGDGWMLPFAECLGVIPSEFNNWKGVFATNSSKIVLVEGDIDRQYFDHFSENYPSIYRIPRDVEIVPYGGKDALRNTTLLKFMIGKFGKVFITYDLDAESDVRGSLDRLGLSDVLGFCAIGRNSPGNTCIEGLLPAEIKRKVYADQYNAVTALQSADTRERNAAKNTLKRKLLEEFTKTKCEDKQLGEFRAMFGQIAKHFS